MKLENCLALAALVSSAIALPVEDKVVVNIADPDFTEEDLAKYFNAGILDFEYPNATDLTSEHLQERAATFIPPGRIRQDCSIGEFGDYQVSLTLADKLQNTPGYHFVKEGDCKNIADGRGQISGGGHTCFAMCALGQDRVIHNKRLGTIAADINVGCHAGIQLTVNGADFFPNYVIEVHHCSPPNPIR